MKKNARKSNAATSTAKTRKETPAAPVVSLVKTKASKAKGTKWNGDWASIPSSRQLLALVIRSIETGVPMGLPTTRDAARDALGYEKEDVAKTG